MNSRRKVRPDAPQRKRMNSHSRRRDRSCGLLTWSLNAIPIRVSTSDRYPAGPEPTARGRQSTSSITIYRKLSRCCSRMVNQLSSRSSSASRSFGWPRPWARSQFSNLARSCHSSSGSDSRKFDSAAVTSSSAIRMAAARPSRFIRARTSPPPCSERLRGTSSSP